MRRRSKRILITLVTLITCLGLAVPPAHAEDTWTWLPGGNFNFISEPVVTLTNPGTGTQISCQLTMAVFASSGSGLAGGHIAQVQGLNANCTGPLGIPFDVVPRALPWPIDAETYDPVGDVTDLGFRGIVLDIAGPGCSARLSGDAFGDYANGPGLLTFTFAVLTASNVAGCFGLLNNGSAVQVEGDLLAFPKQTVTSP